MVLVYSQDANGRTIRVSELNDVRVVGQTYYPGIRLLHNPIREQIMSLPDSKIGQRVELRPVFFFVYNLDN